MGIFSIFNKKYIEQEKKLNKKILELEETIARKDKEISDLINEIDKFNQNISVNTSNSINSKQLELIEKNIKDTKEENNRLKAVIGEYNLSSKKDKYYYKVDIEKFFSAVKYKELVAALLGLELKYIQDVTLETFEKISPDIRNYEDGKIKLQKFLSKEFIEWEIVTYLNKGERVSKIYSKSRKLINIFVENDIEFMEDLLNYDFEKLINLGFKESQIKEFITKREEYYLERRVVK